MATEKTTVMVLKADLQCPCCYKKIKKILCKFPQIRDQVFDEKANEVTITVVCCSPEKIRHKLCSKGGKIIKSIDIKEPPKKPNNPPPPQPEKPKEAPKPPPKEPEKPKEAPKPPPKEPEKPKEAPKPPPKEPEKPKEAPKPPPKEPEKPKEAPKPPPKEPEKPKEAPKPPPPQKTPGPGPPQFIMPPQEMFPAHGFPQPQLVPTGGCCGQCYNGLPGGPCYYGGGGGGGGYGGRPVPPPPTYDYYNYGRPCYVSSCEYFSEENPQGCSIM